MALWPAPVPRTSSSKHSCVPEAGVFVGRNRLRRLPEECAQVAQRLDTLMRHLFLKNDQMTTPVADMPNFVAGLPTSGRAGEAIGTTPRTSPGAGTPTGAGTPDVAGILPGARCASPSPLAYSDIAVSPDAGTHAEPGLSNPWCSSDDLDRSASRGLLPCRKAGTQRTGNGSPSRALVH